MNTKEPFEERKSKSQVKREMLALQALGEALVKLTKQQLSKLPIPLQLLKAIVDAQMIRSREGRRRQLQYIGRLMRECDAEPIRMAFEQLNQQQQQGTAHFHHLEKIRDDLIQRGDQALNEFVQKFSGADRRYLRQLLRKAQEEKQKTLTPKAARQLFHYLKELLEDKYD